MGVRSVGRVAAVALLITAAMVAPTAPAQAAPDLDRQFKTLAEAVEAGAVDATIERYVRARKPIQVLAILDGTPVVEAYGNGTGVKAATRLLAERRRAVLAETDTTAEREYQLVPVVLVRLDSEAAALRLLNHAWVWSLTVNEWHPLLLARSLPVVRQPQLARGGLTGAGAAVAVLDTGADITHPDFGSCTAPGAPAACRVPELPEIATQDNSFDDNGHGTNVSGIAAGVAPGARILPVDVVGTSGGVFSDDGVAGLDWVLTNRVRYNIRAVNMSFGSGSHTQACTGGVFNRNPYQWPFLMLRNANVVPVVATGNSAQTTGSYVDGVARPACTPGAVAVGATFPVSPAGSPTTLGCINNAPVSVDSIACFSQGGALLDLYAPGVGLTAGGQTFTGTSQAAPHVAGVIALLAQARPHDNAATLAGYLSHSDTMLTDSRTGLTKPRLDAVAAVRAAVPVPNDNFVNATVLTTWGGHVGQNTWGATKEPGERAHGFNDGGGSIWYRWTPNRTLTAELTTAGSDFDTLLAVYRPDPTQPDQLQVAAQADNGGPNLTSVVSLPVTAGETLYIAIDGKRSLGQPHASGHARLSWNLPNDNLADAIDVTSEVTAGTPANVGGSNNSATEQYAEPQHCGDTYASASVWYRWHVPSAQAVRIRATATLLACVAVYETTAATPSFGLMSPVTWASNEQGSTVDFIVTAQPGRTYLLAVDGISVEHNCHPVTGQCWYMTPGAPFTLTFG